MFGKIQDIIKECQMTMKSSLRSDYNGKDMLKGKFDLINQIDFEFKDKSEKIKVFLYYSNHKYIF